VALAGAKGYVQLHKSFPSLLSNTLFCFPLFADLLQCKAIVYKADSTITSGAVHGIRIQSRL